MFTPGETINGYVLIISTTPFNAAHLRLDVKAYEKTYWEEKSDDSTNTYRGRKEIFDHSSVLHVFEDMVIPVGKTRS